MSLQAVAAKRFLRTDPGASFMYLVQFGVEISSRALYHKSNFKVITDLDRELRA